MKKDKNYNLTFSIKEAFKDQTGMGAILIVVVVCAATLIMACGASLISTNENDLVYLDSLANNTMIMAEGCAEDILQRINLDPSLTLNNYELPIGAGSCIINLTSDANKRIMVVNAKNISFYKTLEIKMTLNGSLITIDSWEEIN